MLIHLILPLCAALLFSAPALAQSRLSPADLNGLAPGIYIGTWKGKKQLHLTLKQDGTISGTVDGKYRAGRWYVSGEKLCIEFTVIVFEKTRCGVIDREGPWLVGYYSKKGELRIRLRPG